MNLIRLIKLKRINGDLDNLSEQEEYFLSLFINLTKIHNNYLNDSKMVLFSINSNEKIFYCSYYIVWKNIKTKFSINNKETLELIYSVLHRLGMFDYTVDTEDAMHHDKLDSIIENVHNIINGW